MTGITRRSLFALMAMGMALFALGCIGSPWPSPSSEEGGGETAAGDVLDDDASEPDVSEPDVPEPEVPAPPDPTGVLEGKIVSIDGTPLEGASVLACNHSMCFTGSAIADGTFLIDQLEEGPYKVQVMGSLLGFMNMAFNAEVFQDQTTTISRDVVMVAIAEEMAPLLEDEGGTLVVAQGAVELTAEPGALDYPLGFAEAMHGVSVPLSALPPHDVEPWIGAPEGSAAFHFNPFGTESDPGLAFRVLAGLLPSTSYEVWVVEIKLGRLEKAGVVTTDASGVLQSDGVIPGLEALSSVVLVPEMPAESSP